MCGDELLNYAQNKIGTGYTSKAFSEFYSSEAIFESKQLLYAKCEVSHRMRKHIGEEKSLKDMEDIMQGFS